MIKLSRHLLNRSVANRTISKQEAMCEFGDLDLVMCTESIETVSLSSSVKINYGGKDSTNIVQKYKKRTDFHEKNLSLNEFFHKIKNTKKVKSTSRIMLVDQVSQDIQ